VIREGPGYDNPIVAYASDGSKIQMLDETFLNGTIEWVKVIANDGTVGWILKSLLIIPTP
jgi:SH3-like domain-containing protein